MRKANLLYSFEDFALDTDTRELRRSGELLSVEPKVFDLLAHLIANRERVVSKDDLIASVWHGRIVSESALTTCLNAARTALGDNGETQRLIKTLPRKGLRFVGEVREQKAAGTAAANVAPASPKASLPLPDRPSLAVLPFINIGGDPEQDYFADGIVEEMITALSRMRWLFVIARNSSFTFKGRMVDVKEVGRELGVRYVLQGSVRKAAQRLRITAQLVDAATGTNLWADRFEGTLDDIFDLQDQVTTSVIAAISPQLERAEIARAKRKLTESLDAYDLYLHGMAAYHQSDPGGDRPGLAGLLPRDRTRPRLGSSVRHGGDGVLEAQGQRLGCRSQARGGGNQKTRATGRQSRGRTMLSHSAFPDYALAHVAGELDDGAAFIDRALHLNPNLGSVLLASGWVKVWLGEPELAIEHLTQAMRLSPLDPFIHMMQIATSHAHFFAGRFAESASWAQKALREQPEALPAVRIAAASLALSGRDGEARKAVARLLHLDAALRVSNFRETLGPYRHQEYVTQYGDALRKAGLPG